MADASNVDAVATYRACVEQVEKVLIGQRAALDAAFVALITGGHVLLEGVPGVAKTLLVRALSVTIDAKFKRVQFTPDLMPADITGAVVLREGDLVFRPGPLFCDLLLGDEINRAPAKTQSALLEAMQERAVTADGHAHALSPSFTVFATQNPVEQEGTYPLPEAELDRFMMMIKVDYPSEDDEVRILSTHHGQTSKVALDSLEVVCSIETISALRAQVEAIKVSEDVIRYAAKVVRASRENLSVQVGASPRAGLALLRAAKAGALIDGRDYVTPDDIKRWATPVLRHRLVLVPGAEISGTSPDDVVGTLLDAVDVPT